MSHSAPSRYAMIIDWSDEDHVYVVTVPDLAGCRTHGDTYSEAARKGEEAIAEWISAQAARGRVAPATRFAGIGEYFNPLARLAGATPEWPWDELRPSLLPTSSESPVKSAVSKGGTAKGAAATEASREGAPR